MASTPSKDIILSIVIPTYNYAEVVSRAIFSVTSQLCANTELIVVDDGSTDSTQDILATIQNGETPAFRVVRQTNAGPAAARNFGLTLAQGSFVWFLDADDELLPGAVQAVLTAISTTPLAGLILGAHLNRFPDGREKHIKPTPIHGDAHQRVGDYLLKKRISVSHGACVFRRDLVERRPYPIQLRQTEDIPVFAYLVAYAEPVLIDFALARIHKHPDSLRHNQALALSSHHYLAAEVFKFLPEECQSLRASYEAKRALSLFKASCQSSDWPRARYYYRQAFKADWRLALRWRHLVKRVAIAINPKAKI